jgi:predicted SAM-dependent methyltransferase
MWQRRLRSRDRERLREFAGRTDLRLNVGSSDHHLDGWISIDIRPDENTFAMDATRPWPFVTGSAEAINSEHFIEHVSVEEAAAYFREAFRVLRPGGLIRTCTPDLRGIAEAYLAADEAKLEIHRSHGYAARDHGDMVNNYVYSWDHRHIHDFKSLRQLLEAAGFERVEQASFNRSSHELLDGIDRHDPEGLESTILCVDAVKPG